MLSKLTVFINILMLLVFFSAFFVFGNPNVNLNVNSPFIKQPDQSPKPSIVEEVVNVQPIPILMYHSIANYSDIDPKDPNPKLAHGLRIPPLILNNQLKVLKDKGYNTIKFEDLSNYTQFKKALPSKPIIITFDDSWADNVIAYNKLKELGMIGSFGVVSGFMNQPGRLTSAQVKEFSDNGMEITSHTVSHPNLTIIAPASLKNELLNSKKTLEDLIGKEVNTLIYPTGAYNDAVINTAKLVGYQFGASTKGYPGTQDLKKPFELTRIRVECNIGFSLREDTCANLGGSFFTQL